MVVNVGLSILVMARLSPSGRRASDMEGGSRSRSFGFQVNRVNEW